MMIIRLESLKISLYLYMKHESNISYIKVELKYSLLYKFQHIDTKLQMMKDDMSFPVELYFSARGLKDSDIMSKSDPFLKFSYQKTFYGNIEFAGETEVVPNNVNPDWFTKIPVRYFFEMKQPVIIEVFDKDSATQTDFIGRAETTLGAVMGAHQQSLIVDLLSVHNKNVGQVRIRAEKVEDSSFELQMKWRGIKIANVDSHFNFIDKSDPYLKFLKIREDNTFIEVGRTEVVFDNLEPKWNVISLPAGRLFNMNDPLSSFKVECWDHEKQDHKHKLIGELFIRGQQLRNRSPPIQYPMNSTHIKKPGILILQNFRMIPVPNFIDYLQSGLQLNMIAAIDFTASNGSISSGTSLHHLGSQPTQYQQVLQQIWSIIQNYDSDKKIPAFGFGGKPHFPNINENTVSHCFPINDNPANPEVAGLNNLMQCYALALQNMQLSGPTYFAPILQQSFKCAGSLKGSYTYQILLILTDGEIHDMGPTKDIIVRNSNLPMSIIIVGIGKADFSSMVALDGDRGLTDSHGKKCPRDIVQFVPFNKFKGNSQALAQQLLREVPKQVTQYFMGIGKPPQPIPKSN